MKKLKDLNRFLFNRHRKILKLRRRHKEWLRKKRQRLNILNRSVPLVIKKRFKDYIKTKLPIPVKSPSKFSLILYPKEALEFFALVKKYLATGMEVLLDMSDIEMITPDAIVLLLAKLTNRSYTNGVKVYGNRPKNKEIDEVIKESGFYKALKIDKTITERGIIHTKKNTNVDIDVAVESRKLASNKTFNCDKKLHALYRTLIECMANTKKHARGLREKDETWWLAVYNNKDSKITSFSFVDTGVGIFKSARIKNIRKVAIKLGFSDNISILKDLLNGKIESSTGLRHRGKGIPKIFNDFQNNKIHRLHIIANDVYANLTDGIFIELKTPLNGTFYYWEVLPE